MLESFCVGSFGPVVALTSMRWMNALVAVRAPGRAYYALERRRTVWHNGAVLAQAGAYVLHIGIVFRTGSIWD